MLKMVKRKIKPLSPELQHCYDMGFRSVKDGINKVNSNFNLFSTKEKTRVWQKGRHRGLNLKNIL